MLPLIQLAFLVVTPDVPIDARHPEAVQVFRCDFSEGIDVNHDGWPDHWRRRVNADFPAFVPITLAEVPKAPEAPAADASGSTEPAKESPGDQCLRIDLDGGAAALFAPPVPISPLFSYVLEADVQTQGLRHHAAMISVTFLDAAGKRLDERQFSQPQSGTQPWTKLRIGPFSSADERAAVAVIGLHLEPQDEAFDLRGSAWFDNLWLARLPRIRLVSNSPHNVYTSAADVSITCHVSGILQRDPLLSFELLDRSGQTIAQSQERLQGKAVQLGGGMHGRASDGGRGGVLARPGSAPPAAKKKE
jgi:hypothetical protein